jgi:hypothetical protein
MSEVRKIKKKYALLIWNFGWDRKKEPKMWENLNTEKP